MKTDDQDFDTAVALFQQFLRASNYPENIVWVMPENVLTTGKWFIYVRVPFPTVNEAKARRMYAAGLADGRGLLMSTVCTINLWTYCYIWFPKSDEEVPQSIWPHDGSLKLSARDKSSSPEGRTIRRGGLWKVLKFWHRKQQRLENSLFSDTDPVTLVSPLNGKRDTAKDRSA
jgi:hypothetical protein